MPLQRVTCSSQRCGWTRTTVTRRTAQLAQEAHHAVCQYRHYELESSSVQLLLCRHRRSGCPYVKPFKRGQEAGATEERVVHERTCIYA